MKKIFSILYFAIGILFLSAIISTAFQGSEFVVSPLLAVASAVVVSVAGLGLNKLGVAYVTVCGKLTADILEDCTVPLVAGTRDMAYVINFADWENATKTKVSGSNTYSGIVLPTGALAYKISGLKNSIDPDCTQVQVGSYQRFDHMVNMIGYDIDPTIKDQLNAAKDGVYVVIVENFFQGTAGNGAFEVYGADAGLVLRNINKKPTDADTQGGFKFTFMSDELRKEPMLPATVFITSYAATKALVEGLAA